VSKKRKSNLLARVFDAEKIAGDVRSAVIGSVSGSIFGAVVALVTTTFLAQATFEYTVLVNPDGFGQPKSLFDLAEQQQPKLKLNFVPAELRSTYVCEFKRLTGHDWKDMVLQYLDTYRECFDVSQRGEDSYTIYENRRSARLVKKGGAYLCKCGEQ
jgi:hypothetical protein